MTRGGKYKVCRYEWSQALQRNIPVEELVTGLEHYDASVELEWRRKAEPNGNFMIFGNREKVYR